MTLLFGHTVAFRDLVRSLPTDDRRAIDDAVNALGEALLQDPEAYRPELIQPARLTLKHDYTSTLHILKVNERVDVLLCFEKDILNDHMRISLLDATLPDDSYGRFFLLAKAMYGSLLLGTSQDD
jgi:hypothetical protein